MIEIFILSISCISILLGFFALLKQKTYIDTKTLKLISATNLKIPFFGNISTKYPALVFVILGFVPIIMYMNKPSSQPQQKTSNQWTIQGKFQKEQNDTSRIDWQRGNLFLVPFIKPKINKDGSFEIMLPIEEGKQFEDLCQEIDYENENSRGDILIHTYDIDNFNNNRASPIKGINTTLRIYNPITITTTNY